MQVTAAREADWRTILERLVCHLLLDRLPHKALAPIKEQLLEAVEFYSCHSVVALPSSPRRVAAHVSRSYDREIPVLDQD